VKSFLASSRSDGTAEKTRGGLFPRWPAWKALTTLTAVAMAAVLIAGFSSAGAQDPKANNPAADTAPSGNAANGRRVYMADGCFECHNTEGQGGGGGPRLAPNPMPLPAFTHQLRSPRDEMPPYTSKVLPDKEVADIYAFLQAVPKPPSPDTTLLPN
jgi:mono/diheme cytochrome c family protein